MRSRYDRIGGPDVVNLVAESPAAPVQVALVGVLDADPLTGPDGLDLDRLRAEVADRVAGIGHLRQVLLVPRLGGGPPVWVDGPPFEPDRHVVARPLDPPGDEAAFRRACGELMATPLPRDRPLWRLDVLTGSADGTVRIVLRLHHVLADGVMAVRLATVLFGPEHPADDAPAVAPVPSAAALATDAARVRLGAVVSALRRPWELLRAANTMVRTVREGVAVARSSAHWPPTSLNATLRPGRRVAFLDLPLAELRAAAHRYGGTVNDAILAVVAGGIRALLLHRGESLDVPVAASVPVSLHARAIGEGGGTEPANAVAVAVVPLPLHPSCVDRLTAVAARSGELVENARRTGSLGLLSVRWVLRAALRLFRRQRLVQLFVTNVHGPQTRLDIGGARLLRAYPLAPLNGNVALGVGVLSYAGTIGVGVVADRTSVPDLDIFVTGLRDAAAELLNDDGACPRAADAGPRGGTGQGRSDRDAPVPKPSRSDRCSAVSSSWKRVIVRPAGASSREFRDLQGVTVGGASCRAPAAVRSSVRLLVSSTSNATRILGLARPPASTSSIRRFCAGLAISRVARPASRIARRASPSASKASASGSPSTSR